MVLVFGKALRSLEQVQGRRRYLALKNRGHESSEEKNT